MANMVPCKSGLRMPASLTLSRNLYESTFIRKRKILHAIAISASLNYEYMD
jgi:hypothetical protein